MSRLVWDCSPHVLIVTPNLRLKRFLEREYFFSAQKNKNINSANIIKSPQIKSWQQYLDYLWSQFLDHENNFYHVLTDVENDLIWEKITENYFLPDDLFNKSAFLNYAKQAWDLLVEWNLNISDIDGVSLECAKFLELAKKYEDFCKENNYINKKDFYRILLKNLAFISSIVSQEISLFGFDEITPTQKIFFDALKKYMVNSSTVRHCEPAQQARQSSKSPGLLSDARNDDTFFLFPTVDDEIKSAVSWAYHQIMIKKQDNIAIVVPDLLKQRSNIIKYLQQYFPNRQDYNVSGGVVLKEIPIVNNIYLLLKLVCYKKISLLEFRQLSLSPYFPCFYNSSYLQFFIENYYTDVTLGFLCKQSEFSELLFINNLLQKTGSNNYINNWLILLEKSLKILKFTDNLILSSEEYQALNKFKTVLEELFSVNNIFFSARHCEPAQQAWQSSKINFNKFLSLINKIITNTLFEIETSNPKVEVLGVLEAAGINFSSIWFMGLTSDIWPNKPMLNPLLPSKLQIDYNMPHSSAQRELEFSQKIQRRLQQSTDNFIASCAKCHNDEIFEVSPLIDLENIKNISILPIVSSLHDKLIDYKINSCDIIDINAPEINRSFIKQGVTLLNLQAMCPFRSFAQVRLSANTPLSTTYFGLSPMEQGILVHDLLENIFRYCTTKQSLLDLSFEEINKIIIDAVSISLSRRARVFPLIYTKGILELEAKRLKIIAEQWLKIELSRPAFEVIAREKELVIDLKDLQFKIKLDRIDKISTGEKIIIDYKTGSADYLSWFSDRIGSVQLPLYFLAQPEENIKALTFGQINVKKLNFLGIGAEEYFSGIKKLQSINNARCENLTWDNLSNYWRTKIDILVQEVVSGLAAVAPQNASVCKNCSFHSLCRIYEYR